MIKGKKININFILGAFVGIFLALLVMAEGYAILISKSINGINTDIPAAHSIMVRIIAFLVFISTIIIFNSKLMKKINFNRIGVYLILSVIVSIIAAIELSIVIIMIAARIIPDMEQYIFNNYFISVNGVYFIVCFGIGMFILVFSLFVNRKVKYIKFLTDEVKVIEDNGFGKTIKVKGQDELSDLCKSINSMSVELKKKIDNEKKLEDNKNELITNVSHDLRTPLTSVIGYVDLLRKNGFSDKDKFDEYIRIIDERSKDLNKLINELFEYTKLNSHDIKLNYNEVEIGSLVAQVAGEHARMFEREGLKLNIDIESSEIFTNIDVEKIVRALENLLTNARKYSIRDSSVFVKLFKENNNVVISVANRTDNVSKNDLENLFERFYMADKSRNKQDSSGLGLSIVKRIVELHNGKVSVELQGDIIEFKIMLPI